MVLKLVTIVEQLNAAFVMSNKRQSAMRINEHRCFCFRGQLKALLLLAGLYGQSSLLEERQMQLRLTLLVFILLSFPISLLAKVLNGFNIDNASVPHNSFKKAGHLKMAFRHSISPSLLKATRQNLCMHRISYWGCRLVMW